MTWRASGGGREYGGAGGGEGAGFDGTVGPTRFQAGSMERREIMAPDMKAIPAMSDGDRLRVAQMTGRRGGAAKVEMKQEKMESQVRRSRRGSGFSLLVDEENKAPELWVFSFTEHKNHLFYTITSRFLGEHRGGQQASMPVAKLGQVNPVEPLGWGLRTTDSFHILKHPTRDG